MPSVKLVRVAVELFRHPDDEGLQQHAAACLKIWLADGYSIASCVFVPGFNEPAYGSLIYTLVRS